MPSIETEQKLVSLFMVATTPTQPMRKYTYIKLT